jgi:hypothetical protein
MRSKEERLRARLQDCFPPTAFPASAIYAGCAERAAKDPEVQELIQMTSGKTWLDLTDDEVQVLSEYLSLMSLPVFVSLLPAFLQAGLSAAQRGDEGIASIVVSIICPELQDGRTSEFAMQRAIAFKGERARAIAEWLRSIEGLEASVSLRRHAKRALDSYWARRPG